MQSTRQITNDSTQLGTAGMRLSALVFVLQKMLDYARTPLLTNQEDLELGSRDVQENIEFLINLCQNMLLTNTALQKRADIYLSVVSRYQELVHYLY